MTRTERAIARGELATSRLAQAATATRDRLAKRSHARNVAELIRAARAAAATGDSCGEVMQSQLTALRTALAALEGE